METSLLRQERKPIVIRRMLLVALAVGAALLLAIQLVPYGHQHTNGLIPADASAGQPEGGGDDQTGTGTGRISPSWGLTHLGESEHEKARLVKQ